MALKRNEYGMLVRAREYGKTSYKELADQLGLKKGETLYSVSQEKGVLVSRPVDRHVKEVPHKPGTGFVAGPTITKAAGLFGGLLNRFGGGEAVPALVGKERGSEVPAVLRREMEELRAAGLGGVPDPVLTKWGWAIRMKGLILPGGSRTDAMVLLPEAYPEASPIGFFLRKNANVGGLDTSHLYARSYHGAPDLTEEGWNWFCGLAENWIPYRHNLLGYVAAVLALLNERTAA